MSNDIDFIDELILGLSKEVNEDKNKIEKINQFLNTIPKEVLYNESSKVSEIPEEVQTSLSYLKENKDNDNDKQSTLIDKMEHLEIVYKCDKINIEEKNNLYLELFINQKYSKAIDESLINIKYPIFEGAMFLPMIRFIENKNKNDIDIIKKYFSLLGEVSKENYKELFPNNSGIFKINDNNFFDKSEILTQFLFKKITKSLIPSIKKKFNSKDKFNIPEAIDTILSYIVKVLTNTSEFLSFSLKEDITENSHSIKNIIIKFILNNLFSQLSFYLITIDDFTLSYMPLSDFVMLLQKINDFNSEVLYSVYNYSSFKNFTLNDWVKNFYNEPNEEIVRNILITNQQKFNSYEIQTKIKNKIASDLTKENYNLDELIDTIKMLLNDNMNIFSTFRTSDIIDSLIINSCNEIVNIIKSYYNNEVTRFNFSKVNLSIEKNLYIINILFIFFDFINKFYTDFNEHTSLYEAIFQEETSNKFMTIINELKSLLNSYSKLTTKTININEIVGLFSFDNLVSGNDSQKVAKIFKDAEKCLNDFYNGIDICNVGESLICILVGNMFNDFSKKLNEEIDKCFEIEFKSKDNENRKEFKVKEIDFLIDKLKGFINQMIYTKEDISNKEIEKNIREIYSKLNNLQMNKV